MAANCEAEIHENGGDLRDPERVCGEVWGEEREKRVQNGGEEKNGDVMVDGRLRSGGAGAEREQESEGDV